MLELSMSQSVVGAAPIILPPLPEPILHEKQDQQDDREQQGNSHKPLERDLDFVHGCYCPPCGHDGMSHIPRFVSFSVTRRTNSPGLPWSMAIAISPL